MFGIMLSGKEPAFAAVALASGRSVAASPLTLQFQDAPAPAPSAELKPLTDAIGALMNARQYDQALAQAEELLQLAQDKNDRGAQLFALSYKAFVFLRTQRYQESAAALQQLADFSRELNDTAFETEALLYRTIALWRFDPSASERLLDEVLHRAAREQRRPIAVGNACNSVAIEWFMLGEYAKALRCLERANALYTRYAPNTLEHAHTLNNLGAIASELGDYPAAQRYLEQAAALYEELAPNTTMLAIAVGLLGLLAQERGDLSMAMRYYDRALRLFEQLEPNSLNLATALNNISSAAMRMGDLSLARALLEQALAIEQALAPDSTQVADTLNNLGYVLQAQGNHKDAQAYYQRALALYEKHAPGSPRVASIINNLALLAWERKEIAQARDYFERARALLERAAPNSATHAIMLSNLGVIAMAQGEPNQAENYLQQSLALHERLAPNSLSHTTALCNLARVAFQQNELPKAQGLLEQAVAIIEAQRRALPDPETRTLFAERRFDAYPLLALISLRQGQTARAAEVLERGRARALAESLQQRRQTHASLPKPLQQILEERERLSIQRLRTAQTLQQAQLAKQDATPHAQALQRIDAQLRFLDQRLRQEFPRYAEQLQPQPLTLAQIQQSLDDGQALLYHAIVENQLIILALTRTRVQHAVRSIDAERLAREVRDFAEIAGKASASRTAPQRKELPVLGKRLYQQLIAPVAAMLRDAERILLCPDSALHHLPWAALIVAEQQGAPRYWIEQHALHLTPSMAVYRQARQVQPNARGAVIASVSRYGAPQELAQARTPIASLNRRASRSGRLENLDYVPVETDQIRRLFGAQSRVLRESEARPEAVRVAAQRARVVHFACHALADPTRPLDSALLLAPAGKETGMLTAAEVMARWRFQADLVMLSACETNVGLVRRYEGVYGLPRAFLYAGSRSVGASLWRVDDESTALLMQAFYRQYKQGVPKDKALQTAQQQMIRSSRYKDPYFWAGFMLIGDYR